MKCLCPKCRTEITDESPEIPAEGIFLACPECKTTFNLKLESFARRALHKENEIFCSECGNEPGPSVYCQNCHAIYPDFLMAESSSAAKKQLGKILGIFSSSRKVSNNLSQNENKSQAPQKQTAIKGIKLPGQPLTLAFTLLILVALVAGSGVYYYLNKIETTYIDDYITALYVIKSAEDYNNKICEKVAADWKTRPTAATITLATAEQTFLSRGVKDTELVVKRLADPPEKYLASYNALLKLLESYKKHQTMALTPTGTPDSFALSARNIGDEFRKSAADLKTKLPPKLSGKLAEAKAKHKQLQDF